MIDEVPTSTDYKQSKLSHAESGGHVAGDNVRCGDPLPHNAVSELSDAHPPHSIDLASLPGSAA